MKHFKLLFVAISIALCADVIASPSLAPITSAKEFGKSAIVDKDGRTSYIIDLTDDAPLSYPDVASAQDAQRFDRRHSAQVVNMMAAIEQQNGLVAKTVTSWVGNSFSAYLTSNQLAAMRADPKVKRVTEETAISVSAPWYDSTYSSSQWPYYETSSWGRVAINGKQSNGYARVYIIDLGVGFHTDLNSVVLRANAACGSGNNNGCPGNFVVGCYPHPTHVAGIIGATYGNNGVAGVLAGANMYSVSMAFGNTDRCSSSTIVSGTIASAMDYVKWDLISSGTYKIGIVNISINGAEFTSGTTRDKMINLATPFSGGYVYSGAFIAQSAGNKFQDACEHAFNYGTPTWTSNSDGIMIVGGIDYIGQAVTPSNGGYVNVPLVPNESGSNFGRCVDVWAPSKNIVSTYGPIATFSDSDPNSWQSQNVTYQQYVNLSGTSCRVPLRDPIPWLTGCDRSSRPRLVLQHWPI